MHVAFAYQAFAAHAHGVRCSALHAPEARPAKRPTTSRRQAIRQQPAPNVDPESTLKIVSPPKRLQEVSRFVLLSDLHVKSDTLDAALAALSRAHKEAVAREGGIIFCGDFWHARGALPVALLHHVLSEMQSWTVPVLMYPGNHDMSSLTATEQALTPLATTLGADNCLLVTTPTVCLDALFVPFTPDVDEFKQVLAEAAALPNPPQTLFCHAEIAGATISDQLRSPLDEELAVLRPVDFDPENWHHIYSGHLHRRQTLPNTHISYMGSPYEISAGEAGQKKALTVVDRSRDWRTIESIPLDIGRRHFFMSFPFEEKPPKMRPGDVAIIDGAVDDVESPSFRKTVADLRRTGVKIKVRRRAKTQPLTCVEDRIEFDETPKPRIDPLTLAKVTPSVLFREHYAKAKGLSKQATEVACSILEELLADASHDYAGIQSTASLRIRWISCTVDGFGCFREALTYSLAKRRLALILGRQGGSGGNSNGSGKTTLCFAPLWALTGYLGAWATSNVVNDDCKHGTVIVRVVVSGDRVRQFVRDANVDLPERPEYTLEVERSSRRRLKDSFRQSLRVSLDGVDITCLDMRLTQRRLDDLLRTQLLPYVTFFGESTPSILRSTDRELKNCLGAVFPLEIWSEARTLATERCAEYEKNSAGTSATEKASEELLSRIRSTKDRKQRTFDSFERDRRRHVAELETEIGVVSERVDALRRTISEYDQDAACTVDTELSGSSIDVEAFQSDLATAEHALKQCEVAIEESQALTEAREAELAHLSKAMQESVTARAEVEDLEASLTAAVATLGLVDSTSTASISNGHVSSTDGISIGLAEVRKLERKRGRVAERLREGRARLKELEKHLSDCSVDGDGNWPVCQGCMRVLDESSASATRVDLEKKAGALRSRLSDQEKRVADLDEESKSLHLRFEEDASGRQANLVNIRRDALQRIEVLRKRQAELLNVAGVSSSLELRHKELSEQTYEPKACVAEILETLGVASINAAAKRLRGDVAQARSQLVEAMSRRSVLREKKERLDKARKAHDIAQAEMQSALREQDKLSKEMELRLRESNPAQDSLSTLQEEHDVTVAELARLQQETAHWRGLASAAREADQALGARGIQSFVLEAGLYRLQVHANRYLDVLSDGELRALFQGYTTYRGSARRGETCEVIQRLVAVRRVEIGDVVKRQVAQLSSGQRRRVDLACALAFADVCAERGYESSLLVVDEALRYLDTDGVQRLATLLEQLATHESSTDAGECVSTAGRRESVLVVSHDDREELVDVASGGVDVCKRVNDASTVTTVLPPWDVNAVGSDESPDDA